MKNRRVFCLFFCILFVLLAILNGFNSDTLFSPVQAKMEEDRLVFLPFISKPLIISYQQMVFIPSGEFKMGCADGNPDENCEINEQPLHTVYLDAYYIDKYEVTNSQYTKCVAAGVCEVPMISGSATRSSYYGNSTYDEFPVIAVDWYRAYDYCNWVSKRLPTEAEWEKAARGDSDTRMYPWGNIAPDCTLSNFSDSDDCVGDTTQVGSYPTGASPYGVLDMSGNVFEWTNDWYSSSPYNNPQGPDTGTYKVLRSGGYDIDGIYIRTAFRYISTPDRWGRNGGFRCAVSSGE